MKLLFPIYRFNWYRTVAPVIDEALRRGHEVLCLHNEAEQFASNRPDESLLPKFRHGQPSFDAYHSSSELDSKVLGSDADAIISIDLPLDSWLTEQAWANRSFRYITIATTDTLRRLHSPLMLEATEAICIRSEREIDACINDHASDPRPLMEKAKALGRDGERYLSLLSPRLNNQWDSVMTDVFRAKAHITGFPFLDGINLIDPQEVRKRWGIQADQAVIGMWSTPTLGRGCHGSWDHLFTRPNSLCFRYQAIRDYGLKAWKQPYWNEERLLRVIRAFADRHNAKLIIKLRHYQTANESVFSRFADRVVCEDCYYPHSALEISAIANLMIGFHTTGIAEAVYAGSPGLNLVIPRFPSELHMNTLSYFNGMHDIPGVVWRWPVEKVEEYFERTALDDFSFDWEARAKYIKDYGGPEGGHFSSRVIDVTESVPAIRPEKGILK